MNWGKTFLLMAAMSALFLLVGYKFGGSQGMTFALFFAVIMNFGSYWFSDKIVLWMYGAKPISEQEAPQLYSMVGNLTRQAGIPMPKLYIINESTPNAFATGRNPQHAAVAVTAGLMGILNNDEVEGVIAHELAHVKNRDILIGTVAATLAAAIMRLSWMGMFFGGRSDDDDGGGAFGGILVLIFGWVASMIIQMWISRTREYAADAAGAKISGKPLALANALLKLERGVQVAPMQAEPATAHMFIVNPFSGGRAAGFVANLFSTHPPIPERVARLQAMADDMQYPNITR